MRWADQLIKLSNFELERLQVRLAEVAKRREAAEMKLVVLTAQGEAEIALARSDPEMAWNVGAYADALKRRKLDARHAIDQITAEEAGVRDAIAEAFETLKKYEQVAENARLAEAHQTARRETAALDEIGLRRAAGR
jgi:flagellar FliJ protein